MHGRCRAPSWVSPSLAREYCLSRHCCVQATNVKCVKMCLWCHSGCLSGSSQALLASFIPFWLPQEGLKRQSFLIRRTLTKHAQACTNRTSRPTPNWTETGPTSRGLQNSTESASRERQATPTRASGAAQEPKRKPRERKRPPGSSIVAPWRCPSAPKHTL